jgi:deoxycytidylate deaminase
MINPKDIKNFSRLIKELEKRKSIKSTHYRYDYGSLLINKNCFSYGFNNYVKTHPRTIQEVPGYIVTLHSEIDVVNHWNPNWDLNGATLYVCGLIRSGKFVQCSKPCNPCMRVIEQFGIQRVVYSTNFEGQFALNEFLL